MDSVYAFVDGLRLSEGLVEIVRGGLTGLYLLMLLFVAGFGFHRWHLVYLYYKHRKDRPRCKSRFLTLPRITVQLPMYNEPYVAQRIIEACCNFDWPRDRLQIQVLDDSTDDTRRIAQATVRRMQVAGHDVEYIHRTDRTGYKAGALENAMKSATGEFIAIFDADFTPQPEILHQLVHYFTDETVGMVQARWGHINREHSVLTQAQSILLDGHFVVEHTARNRSGRFFNFNGTAGMWRRICMEDGGGWQHDTLTEDLDLSYRAQMAGWRLVFLPEVTVPAELPVEMNAFKTQQMRWTKGGIQVARKLLPRVLTSHLPWRIKAEAFFHLTGPSAYFYMLALTLLLFPALTIRFDQMLGNLWYSVLDFSLLWVASCSASAFYMSSQREVCGRWRDKVKYIPYMMSLGIGMSLCNSVAFFGGLFGRRSEFVRTPKFGEAAANGQRWKHHGYHGLRNLLLPSIELLLGLYFTVVIFLSFYRRSVVSLPFLIIFQFGYLYVGLMGLLQRRVGRARAAADETDTIPQPAPAVHASSADGA